MSESQTRPNFIVVMAEQHRGDCLSIENHPVLLTPTIDAIGGRGTHFTRAYSTCPVCIPARRSFLSGQHPTTHGIRSYKPSAWEGPTVAGVLGDHGYQTCWFGRDHHQEPPRKRYGYDDMRTVKYNRHAGYSEYADWLARVQPEGAGGVGGCGIMNNDWTARPWHMDEACHPTNWTVNQALEFMQRRDPTCPFFMTLSFLAAHPPLLPPACYFERYIRTGVPNPWIGDWAVPPTPSQRFGGQDPSKVDLKGEALLSTRAAYYGLINHLDDQLNRLFNGIDGIDRETSGNTVVMFCSDHGEMLGDHYFWRKQQAYEGSARIPFLVRGPHHLGLKSNQTVEAPVCLEDIMPTVLDLAGVPCPAGVDGKSLVPLLRGETTPVRPHVHLVYENAWDCLTDGKEKYVRHIDGREQLFDLRTDPGECRDRAGDALLADRLALWRREIGDVMKRDTNRKAGGGE